jgi:anti-sigma factor RsiW
MTANHLNHLSDEHFSDLLAGDNAPEAAMLHLERCNHCREELVELRSGMASFKQASLAWAQAEAPRRVPVPSRWDIRRHVLPAWSFAAAMVVAVAAVGVRHEVTNREIAQQTVASVAVAANAPTGNEQAEDNRLLMSIDQELSYQERPSVPVTDLVAEGATVQQVEN